MTDADYADDLALLTNTYLSAESLLHSLEQAAGGINLQVNACKTFIYFKQGVMCPLYGRPLKLVDEFMYLSSNIPSTETDVSICLGYRS